MYPHTLDFLRNIPLPLSRLSPPVKKGPLFQVLVHSVLHAGCFVAKKGVYGFHAKIMDVQNRQRSNLKGHIGHIKRLIFFF